VGYRRELLKQTSMVCLPVGLSVCLSDRTSGSSGCRPDIHMVKGRHSNLWSHYTTLCCVATRRTVWS